jgi:hypothetical protein
MEELRHSRAAQAWLAAGREKGREEGSTRRPPASRFTNSTEDRAKSLLDLQNWPN